ncbi:MAG: nitroreductase family protein [Planctomycetota bacterium]|jgi:nitroreductase/NAD-dependent dihydropyrimidine dehydrogenase PreA subunit|nr:nitroreductase family protein [Planctomycetota bacterium]
MNQLGFQVDPGRCDRCGVCVRDCPRSIIRQEEDGLPAIPAESGGDCLECQHCLAVCPAGAVSIFGLKPESSLSLAGDAWPTRRQMKTLVRGRRSVRQYRDEAAPAALVDELLADLAYAPTGCNDRDLDFIVVADRASLEKLRENIVSALEARQRAGAALPGFLVKAMEAHRRHGKDGFFRGAPQLLVVSPGTRATCGREDAVLALAYFEFLAQSAGLGTAWCGMLGFAAEAAPEIRLPLGLRPDAYFYAMMFGCPDVRYARTIQREAAARIRQVRL